MSDLSSLCGYDVSYIVSTVPAAAQFTVPDGLLKTTTTVVLDAAYKPRETALLMQVFLILFMLII